MSFSNVTTEQPMERFDLFPVWIPGNEASEIW